jgi:hypothetical protein
MDFIKTYFAAEKSESLLFIGLGIAAIAFSGYGWLKWNETFYKGLAIPLILIAVIQLVVGGTVYFRTDKQMADIQSLHQTNPTEFRSQEVPRMETVMKNFGVYKKIEISFVLMGVLLIVLMKQRPFWLGIGVGMLMQGAVMLALDIFAEQRGEKYQSEIRSIAK